jgi:steroid 5-alpha reductase family enzyme
VEQIHYSCVLLFIFGIVTSVVRTIVFNVRNVLMLMYGLIILLFIYLLSMVALVQFKEDTSIGNFTWGGGVLLVTLYTFFTMSSFLARQIIITSIISIWSSRLIMHIYKRYTGKDPRFASWKWKGLTALIINFGWIFGQSIMIAIMAYPSFLINSTPALLTSIDSIAIFIWLIGYGFEACADYQLYAFMRNPLNKGKVMRSGLWKYSRHPNYFGELVMWWGIFLLALSVPFGWSTIITPLTITITIVFITGIPWVEAAMAHNPEYQEYKKKTSILIPWLPQR